MKLRNPTKEIKRLEDELNVLERILQRTEDKIGAVQEKLHGLYIEQEKYEEEQAHKG